MNKNLALICLAISHFVAINTMDRSTNSHKINSQLNQNQKIERGMKDFLATQKATFVSQNGQTVYYLTEHGNRQSRNIKELQKTEFYFFRDQFGRISSRNDKNIIQNNGCSREELTHEEWQEYLRNI